MANMTDDIEKIIHSFLNEIKDYSHYSQICERIEKAQKQIGYNFKDISFLKLAFCRTKLPNGKKNYMNETLAQIGDFVLTLVLAELSFSQGKGKQEIQKVRQENAKNSVLYEFTNQRELYNYCYHEYHFYNDNTPEHEEVSVNNHDSIVEAIIGAIYFDGGLDRAREWILSNLKIK